MSGQPPPNFNPNESLLEGGTAPITAQAGGAGNPVPQTNIIRDAVEKGPEAVDTSQEHLGDKVTEAMSDPDLIKTLTSLGDKKNEATASATYAAMQALRMGRSVPEATAVAKTAIDIYLDNESASALQDAITYDLVPSVAQAKVILSTPRPHAVKEKIFKAMIDAYFNEKGTGTSFNEESATKASVIAAAIAAMAFDKEATAQAAIKEPTAEEVKPPMPAATDDEEAPQPRVLNPSGGDDPVILEYYTVSSPATGKETYKALMEAKRLAYENQDKTWKSNLNQKIALYEARRKKGLWAPIAAANASRAPVWPLPGKLPRAYKAQILTMFTRAAYTLPESAETLIAIPPIRGNISLFIDVLYTLQSLEVIKTESAADGSTLIKVEPGFVLVFTSPFYASPYDEATGLENTSINVLLLSIFLDIESNNHDQVFVLAEPTTDNYTVGTVFHNYRGRTAMPTTPLVNWLEPSYICYSEQRVGGLNGICLSVSTGDEPNIPLGKRAANSSPGDPVPRLFKPDPAGEGAGPFDGYLTVRTLDMSKPLYMPEPILKDTDSCATLKRSAQADEVFRNSPILYLQPVALSDEKSDLKKTEIVLVFRLAYQKPHRPLCEGLKTDLIQPPKPRDQFYPSPDAQVAGVNYYNVDMDAGVYSIREPLFDNRVYQDWMQEKFTDDEAKFLNSLGFSPDLFEKVFLDPITNWQYELAKFLEGLVISKCFRDDTLQLRRECEQNRKFLERIYAFFVENNLSSEVIEAQRAAAAQEEIARYRRELYDQDLAKQDLELHMPDNTDARPIEPDEFHAGKKKWGTLYIYDTTGDEVATNVIMVNKSSGRHMYYTVRVPRAEYEDDTKILYTKLDNLRLKYPGYYIIY